MLVVDDLAPSARRTTSNTAPAQQSAIFPLVECLGCSDLPRASTVLAPRHDQAGPSRQRHEARSRRSIGDGPACEPRRTPRQGGEPALTTPRRPNGNLQCPGIEPPLHHHVSEPSTPPV